MKENFLYNFIHIPKCAGTTIRKNILYNKKNILEVYKLFNPEFSTKAKTENYINKLKNRNSIEINFGHHVHYGIHELFSDRDSRYITFLRDPFDRIISVYNYFRTMQLNGVNLQKCNEVLFKDGKIMDFGNDWLEKNKFKVHNKMTIFLYYRFFGKLLEPEDLSESILSEIYSILDKFYFIGLTERKEDIYYFYHLLGLKKRKKNDNVSGKFFIPKDYEKLKEKLFPLYQYDLQLYEFAEAKNIQFKKEHPNFERGASKMRLKMEKDNRRMKIRRKFRTNMTKFKGIITNSKWNE